LCFKTENLIDVRFVELDMYMYKFTLQYYYVCTK